MESFVHADPKTKQLVAKSGQLARCGLPILITGESGTGKEVLAKGIHKESGRGRFVTVDCSVLNCDTARSEVFGAIRGAYTGSVQDRPGLVEIADQGTLFIDEIGEAGPEVQMMLLRFLQCGEYRRVGDYRTRKANVRVISATNRDLDQEVLAGRFREDLLFRLRVAHVAIPPLRDRRLDIAALASHLVAKYERLTGQLIALSAEEYQHIVTQDWLGNVRQLENTIAMIAAGIREFESDSPKPNNSKGRVPSWADLPFKLARRTWEKESVREYLELRLISCSGNVTRASESAGIGRQYFQAWMKRVGLDANDYRKSST